MTYILKNATVITMDDQRVFYNTDLFVANGRILKIAPHIEPLGVNTVDCTGKFLLPGLIDCHVHMDSNEITEMLLANGVTACRNMWGFPETQQWKLNRANDSVQRSIPPVRLRMDKPIGSIH